MFPTRTLLFIGMILGVGCSAMGTRISYCDRNADGKVDLESHRYPGGADTDWELRDKDFDTRYEKKVLYADAVIESSVDRAVPTGVRMENR